jgi:hypothetical protein
MKKAHTSPSRQPKVTEFDKEIELLIPPSEPPGSCYVSSALCATKLKTDPSRNGRRSRLVLANILHGTNPSGLLELMTVLEGDFGYDNEHILI